MAAAISSRKLTKELLHKLAVLASVSAPVHVAPLSPQQSARSWRGSWHSVQRVRKLCAQSAWQLHRRGADDVRRAFVDLRDGSSGQQRWYVRSNSEKAKPDADSIATEMIYYAASCRNQGKLNCYKILVVNVCFRGNVYVCFRGNFYVCFRSNVNVCFRGNVYICFEGTFASTSMFL